MTGEGLLRELVAADVANPAYGGPGEAEAARLVAGWLRARGVAPEVTDVAPGRPNVVARTGRGDGRVVLLLGHTDTVALGGCPPGARVHDGRLHGRGSYDMAGGLVAALLAFERLHDVRGTVIVAAVADEEAGGCGTRALLRTGLRADAAIVPEPTDLRAVRAHKGFTAFRVRVRGRAAHGSRHEEGEDAILAMAPALQALAAIEARLAAGPVHPLLGRGSLHAGTIGGGTEASSYPAECVLEGEWRTVPGDDARAELEAQVPGIELTYEGAPLDTPEDAPVVEALSAQTGGPAIGQAYWTDAALLDAAGIPTALLGPSGGGAHADDEHVELASVTECARLLEGAVRRLVP